MKKLTSLGVAAFAAMVAVLAIVGSFSPAQAYPEVKIELKVNKTVLFEGQQFTATATGNVTCSWALTWNGVHRNADRIPNKPFNTTYTAPPVSKVTKIPLKGTCSYDADETPATPTFRQAVHPTSATRTIMITVLPRGAAATPPGGSDLPNTGGPDWRVLAGGLVLLLSGIGAVTIARRRAEEAEVQATQA